MAFSEFLNPIFSPLLNYNPLFGIFVISLIISILITVAYKYLTNQKLMKEMKEKIKLHQKNMKEHRNDKQKMMQIQKEAMEVNMQYMMHSFKPTLITFLPLILIFGWLNANLAFDPIQPGQEFSSTIYFQEGAYGNVSIVLPDGITFSDDRALQAVNNNAARWNLKGEAGEYVLEYTFNDVSYTKDVLITNQQKYAPVSKTLKDDVVKQITIDNPKLKALDLGFMKLGWLGTYILFSLVLSIVLRKAFKIY